MNVKNILTVCALILAAANADKTESSKACLQKKGIFLEARNDPSDTRYACLSKKKHGDERKKYCVNFDGKKLCYNPKLGNMNYCDLKSKEFNGRSCSLSLGYLYDMVKFDDQKHKSSKQSCVQNNGVFLERINDPTDKRFACLLPKNNGDERSKYCATFNNKDLCYAPDFGNIAYCELNNKNYNSRGCALGLGYLWDMSNIDKESIKNTCQQKNGYFLENTSDPSDNKYACLLPKNNGDEKTKYCVNYDNKDLCYAPELGNLSYCDLTSSERNGRECAVVLTYLWENSDIKNQGNESNKKESSKNTCQQKHGYFLENANDSSDNRYACLLPKNNGDEKTKYCATFNNKDLCYASDLSNVSECDMNNSQYNSRGCALGLGYLWDMSNFENQGNESNKKESSKNTCQQKHGYFLENTNDSSDNKYACLLPKNNGDEKTKYCVNYDNKDLCYAPELGNLSYCDLTSSERNGRECAVVLTYLWENSDIKNQGTESNKKESDKITCQQKHGYFLENTNDTSDNKYACLLPKRNGDEKTKYCSNYDNKDLCYAPELGNLPYCDMTSNERNGRECAVVLTYLWENKGY
eukprot:jgi/Orpsp1_1/1180572/evm.model.c7180000073952.1